jgi:chaperonin cofactor prefoldin
MKKSELRTIIREEMKRMREAWDTDTDIKQTGEHAGKTIAQLQGELETLKKRSKTYQEKGESVPEEIKKKEHQITFAIRAKRNWKGGTK